MGVRFRCEVAVEDGRLADRQLGGQSDGSRILEAVIETVAMADILRPKADIGISRIIC